MELRPEYLLFEDQLRLKTQHERAFKQRLLHSRLVSSFVCVYILVFILNLYNEEWRNNILIIKRHRISRYKLWLFSTWAFAIRYGVTSVYRNTREIIAVKSILYSWCTASVEEARVTTMPRFVEAQCDSRTRFPTFPAHPTSSSWRISYAIVHRGILMRASQARLTRYRRYIPACWFLRARELPFSSLSSTPLLLSFSRARWRDIEISRISWDTDVLQNRRATSGLIIADTGYIRER